MAEVVLVTRRAGWILAGGESRRMGEDKATLPMGDGPLVVMVASLVEAVCGSVTVVGDVEKYGHLGLGVISDNIAGLGPLGGMEAALGATTAEWNLIVACDMPRLDSAVFEELFAAAVGHDCAVPQHPDGKVQPLCAVYNKRCHAVVAAALESGVRKVTDGLRGLAVRYVQMGDSNAFTNLNTPEDLRKYRNG